MGSRLCLDFTNTVSGMRVVTPVERLGHYLDLVSWGEQVGVLKPAEARALAAVGRREEAAAERVRERAIALREALFRLFRSTVEGRPGPAGDLSRVNAELVQALAHRRLVSGKEGISLGWEEGAALDRMLWPVVEDAAQLLAGPGLERVRLCEATATDGCGWLFFDTTKGRTRRWCSMRDCGNRAKARRFYAKAREEGGKGG
jgi:predicted RNA-binding Zn ribbon-like protein